MIEKDESYSKCTIQDQDILPVTDKVVRVQWGKEDNLLLDPRQVLNKSTMEEPTRSDVARITSKIYDPVGFKTPLTVRLKLFYQSLFKKRLNWDEVLEQ